MSAYDDYPWLAAREPATTAALDEIDRLRAQNEGLAEIGLRLTETIDRMQRWKTEATTVIAAWDEVWITAGEPGPLGFSKAAAVQDYIVRLRSQVTVLDMMNADLHEIIREFVRSPPDEAET